MIDECNDSKHKAIILSRFGSYNNACRKKNNDSKHDAIIQWNKW